MTTRKHDDPKWRMAAGHMLVAAEAATKLAIIVQHVQDIQKQDLAVYLVSDEMAAVARDLADEMVNAMRNAVTAKRTV